MTSFFTALIDHSDLSQSNVLVMMSQLTVLVFADVFALEPQLLGPGNSENHMVILWFFSMLKSKKYSYYVENIFHLK